MGDGNGHYKFYYPIPFVKKKLILNGEQKRQSSGVCLPDQPMSHRVREPALATKKKRDRAKREVKRLRFVVPYWRYVVAVSRLCTEFRRSSIQIYDVEREVLVHIRKGTPGMDCFFLSVSQPRSLPATGCCRGEERTA